MASTHDILKRLVDAGVEFVLVGGLAAIAHGSVTVTEDVDVCAPLSPENLSRIIAALADTRARFSNTGHNEPLPANAEQLVGFKNVYLLTDVGEVDFLSEIDGVGAYAQVRSSSIEMDFGPYHCRVLDLDSLIAAKRAAQRPKDRQVLLELEAIRSRMRQQQ